MPQTRMGNIALTRQTWAKAVEYKRKWDKYMKEGGDAPERDLAMDTLKGVLEGKILVQNHCYRADEIAIMIDMANEFGYDVPACRTSAKRSPGNGSAAIPPKRSESSTRRGRWHRARWPTSSCGPAIHSAITRGPSACGSTAL